MVSGAIGPEPESPRAPRIVRVRWKAALPPLSEVALLSHSPCSPSEREAGHEATRLHNFSRGAMAAWPLPGRAQQKAMPVIGVLSPGQSGPFATLAAGFRQGLSEAGYVEGQNVVIEYRWAEGHYDRLPALAADLGRKVDLIVANSPPAALAAKSATSTIPIVFRGGTDPVGDGLVASLARPGGNLTGVVMLATEVTAKRLELLAELVPRAGVIALLVNPSSANAERVIREVQEAARAKGLQLHVLKASTESEI